MEVAGDEALPAPARLDPGDDRSPLPAAVAGLGAAMGVADAVLMCTLEHAGALEGSMKDPLEWTVGSTVMAARPDLDGRAELDVDVEDRRHLSPARTDAHLGWSTTSPAPSPRGLRRAVRRWAHGRRATLPPGWPWATKDSAAAASARGWVLAIGTVSLPVAAMSIRR